MQCNAFRKLKSKRSRARYTCQAWYWWNSEKETTWDDPVQGMPRIVPSKPVPRAYTKSGTTGAEVTRLDGCADRQ